MVSDALPSLDPRSTSSPTTRAGEKSDDVFVGSIDNGITSSRFLIFDTKGNPVASHQVEFKQMYPLTGWHEHDPLEIVSVETCISKACEEFTNAGHSLSSIKAVGITNQRETTCVWDTETGEPLYNSIVWTDTRTASIVRELKARPGADELTVLAATPSQPLADRTAEDGEELPEVLPTDYYPAPPVGPAR